MNGDQSFPYLVERVCLEHHKTVLAMQKRCRLGHVTLLRWMRGTPESYQKHTVKKFCRAYGLKFREVWALIQEDDMRRLDGIKVPVPPLDWVKVGPYPKNGRNGKSGRNGGRLRHLAVAGMTLLSLTAGSVPAYAGTIHEPQVLDSTTHYRKLARHPWRRRLALPTTWAA